MSKLEDALARLQTREVKHKSSVKTLQAALVRKASVVTTAAVYGVMKRMGVPQDIKGFPWKLGVWALVTTVEATSKGLMQQTAGGIGDITLGLWTHGAIAMKSWVAGDGEGGEV